MGAKAIKTIAAPMKMCAAAPALLCLSQVSADIDVDADLRLLNEQLKDIDLKGLDVERRQGIQGQMDGKRCDILGDPWCDSMMINGVRCWEANNGDQEHTRTCRWYADDKAMPCLGHNCVWEEVPVGSDDFYCHCMAPHSSTPHSHWDRTQNNGFVNAQSYPWGEVATANQRRPHASIRRDPRVHMNRDLQHHHPAYHKLDYPAGKRLPGHPRAHPQLNTCRSAFA